MKTFKTTEEALNYLYNKNDLPYSDFVHLPEYEGKSSLFVTYITKQFNRFISIVSSIEETVLIHSLTEFGSFEGIISKRRFINLLNKISDECIKVLKECYLPNPAQALQDLERLLGMNNRKLMPYLIEQLINYCTFDYPQNAILYRVRDEKIGNDVDNCWHTPFHIRQHSYAGRFSSPGFPCLYLASSPETCCAEVGHLRKGKARWLGKFKLRENQLLGCLDLTIPGKNKIEEANAYEQIQYFLTYPIRILCTTYAEHKSDTFGEEYLFSQALVNVLSHPLDENSGMCRATGIIYDSTKHRGGINIALPAQSNCIPPSLNETYSNVLQDKFHHEKPTIIEIHESVKK